jgi:hypothetical protein
VINTETHVFVAVSRYRILFFFLIETFKTILCGLVLTELLV